MSMLRSAQGRRAGREFPRLAECQPWLVGPANPHLSSNLDKDGFKNFRAKGKPNYVNGG